MAFKALTPTYKFEQNRLLAEIPFKFNLSLLFVQKNMICSLFEVYSVRFPYNPIYFISNCACKSCCKKKALMMETSLLPTVNDHSVCTLNYTCHYLDTSIPLHNKCTILFLFPLFKHLFLGRGIHSSKLGTRVGHLNSQRGKDLN